MQQIVQSWIREGSQLKLGLEQWAAAVNTGDAQRVAALYSGRARLFPTFSNLKTGTKEILQYFEESGIARVQLHYGTVTYHPDERMVEGEYTFRLIAGEEVTASFAFKFNAQGEIIEHASAPRNIYSWRVRNEVCISTLLTAATVQSVLKRTQALEAVA